jgi:hypothetical protein
MHNPGPLELLLYLIDSEYPGSVEVNANTDCRDLMKSTVRLAKANGLFYSLTLKLQELNGDLSFLERDLARQRQRMGEFKRTLMLLNRVSEDAGLPFTVIKACSSIPHVPRDIDIFVPGVDRERFSQLLARRGMKCLYDSEVETSFVQEGFMEVDIYTRIRYVGVEFFDASFLQGARTEGELLGIRYPGLSYEANFLIVFIHSLFGHRVLTLLDFLHLKSLMKIMDVALCQEYAYGKGWGPVLDLGLEHLRFLCKSIYGETKRVSFPYLFSRSFVLRCISVLDGIEVKMSPKQAFSLELSIFMDGIVHQVNRSPFYDLLAGLRLGRLITPLGLFVRKWRGDTKR